MLQVSVLFQDHADLLVEFTHFLPDASGAGSVHFSQPRKNHTIQQNGRGSPMTMARPIPVDKVLFFFSDIVIVFVIHVDKAS